jgi:ADP-heptose:LPS heptosyltransferase
MQKLILANYQSPGDLVMLTAAIRDLHKCYPNHFLTDVRTGSPDLWENNPYLTPLDARDPNVKVLECHYPLINCSNKQPVHFLNGFIDYLNAQLGLQIKLTRAAGDIHLSEAEKSAPSLVQQLTGSDIPYWIIVAGGKLDYTIKWWHFRRWQAVVDHFQGKILFVQIGEKHHYHPPLNNVLDLRGQTPLRELIRLVYHAQGVLCPVTLLMHLAAAVQIKPATPVAGATAENERWFSLASRERAGVRGAFFPEAFSPAMFPSDRPCVVVAGGREPPTWEAYSGHEFLHTIGILPCCASGGCWRSRSVPIGDGDDKDHASNVCLDVVDNLPRCMDLITPAMVVAKIDQYLQTRQLRILTPEHARVVTPFLRCEPRRAFSNQIRDRLFVLDQVQFSTRNTKLANTALDQPISL